MSQPHKTATEQHGTTRTRGMDLLDLSQVFSDRSEGVFDPSFAPMPASAEKLRFALLDENEDQGRKPEHDPSLRALTNAVCNLSSSKILDVVKTNHCGFCLTSCFVLARLNFFQKMQETTHGYGHKLYIPKHYKEFSYSDLMSNGLKQLAYDVAFGYSFSSINNKKKNVLLIHRKFVTEVANHVADTLKNEFNTFTHFQDQDKGAQSRPYYHFPIFEISQRIFEKLETYPCKEHRCTVDLRNFYVHFLIYLTAYPYFQKDNEVIHGANQDSGRVSSTAKWWKNPLPSREFFDATAGFRTDTNNSESMFTMFLCPSMLELCSVVTTLRMSKQDRIDEYPRIFPVMIEKCRKIKFNKKYIWMLKATASHFPDIAENPKIAPQSFFHYSYGATCGIELLPILSDCCKSGVLQYPRTSWGDHQLALILALTTKNFVYNYIKFYKEHESVSDWNIGYCNMNKKQETKLFAYPPISKNYFQDNRKVTKRLAKIQKNQSGEYTIGDKNPMSLNINDIPTNIRNNIVFDDERDGTKFMSTLHVMRLGGVSFLKYINDYELFYSSTNALQISIPKFDRNILWNSPKVYDYLILQALQDNKFREDLGNEKLVWLTKKDAEKIGLCGDINICEKTQPSPPQTPSRDENFVASIMAEFTPPAKKRKCEH